AAAVLLAYLPFAEDETLADAVRDALAAVAGSEGNDVELLVQALAHRDPARRAAAAEVLCRVDAVTHRDAVRRLLADADASVRLRTGLALVAARDPTALAVLIDLLPDVALEDGRRIEELLCRVAGDQTPAVALWKDEASRRRCREAWRDWWR